MLNTRLPYMHTHMYVHGPPPMPKMSDWFADIRYPHHGWGARLLNKVHGLNSDDDTKFAKFIDKFKKSKYHALFIQEPRYKRSKQGKMRSGRYGQYLAIMFWNTHMI